METAATFAELKTIFAENEQVVVLFTAPGWCVPCRRVAPHYEAVAQSRSDYTFVTVDVDWAEQALRGLYDIQSVPTMVIVRGGVFAGNVLGRTALAISKELDV